MTPPSIIEAGTLLFQEDHPAKSRTADRRTSLLSRGVRQSALIEDRFQPTADEMLIRYAALDRGEERYAQVSGALIIHVLPRTDQPLPSRICDLDLMDQEIESLLEDEGSDPDNTEEAAKNNSNDTRHCDRNAPKNNPHTADTTTVNSTANRNSNNDSKGLNDQSKAMMF